MAHESEVTPRPLNPEMVYQPASPTKINKDGEGDEAKFPFSVIVVLRCIVFGFFLAAVLLLYLNRPSGFDVIVGILILVNLAWNLYMIARFLSRISKNTNIPFLPKFVCQIGNCRLSCFGNDDDDDGREDFLLEEPDKNKQRGRNIYRLIDLVLSAVVLIMAPIDYSAKYGWWKKQSDYVAFPLIYVACSLQLVIVALSYSKWFRDVMCIMRPEDEEGSGSQQYRIRLPQESPGARSTGSQVSVAA